MRRASDAGAVTAVYGCVQLAVCSSQLCVIQVTAVKGERREGRRGRQQRSGQCVEETRRALLAGPLRTVEAVMEPHVS